MKPTEADRKAAEKIFDSLGYQYGTEERQSAIHFIALGLANATRAGNQENIDD